MLYGPDRCLSDCYICHLWEGKRGIRGEQSEEEEEGEARVREGRRGEGMVWQVREGVNGSVRACACACVCVSLADLLVRKQIFSLSDSINLPHLS